MREVVNDVAAASLKFLCAHECTSEDSCSAAFCTLLKVVNVPHLNTAIGIGLVAHRTHDDTVL